MRCNRGATAVEYGLLAALVGGAIAVASAGPAAGQAVKTTMCRAADYMAGRDGSGCGGQLASAPVTPPTPPDPYTDPATGDPSPTPGQTNASNTGTCYYHYNYSSGQWTYNPNDSRNRGEQASCQLSPSDAQATFGSPNRPLYHM